MKSFVQFIKDNLKEHICIEACNSGMFFEKYGLFDGCEDLISLIVNDIKSNFDKSSRNNDLIIEYYATDLSNINNIFFEHIIINTYYVKDKSGGRCYIDNDVLSENKLLNTVEIDVNYSDIDWRSVEIDLAHELTHAYEHYNRCLSNSVRTLDDIKYFHELKHIKSLSQDISNIRELVEFYAYFIDISELNAFIAQWSKQIIKVDDVKFDLRKDNFVNLAFNIIKKTSEYKKYNQLFEIAMNLHECTEADKRSIVKEYNSIFKTNKSFSAIAKEMKTRLIKAKYKIDSTIPKIVCEYIIKHTNKRQISISMQA